MAYRHPPLPEWKASLKALTVGNQLRLHGDYMRGDTFALAMLENITPNASYNLIWQGQVCFVEKTA